MRPISTARSRQSFADYYLRHVAISEGCGCAELVIRRKTPKIGPPAKWPGALRRRLTQGFAQWTAQRFAGWFGLRGSRPSPDPTTK